MANEEHLRILLEGGVADWNEWRRAHATVIPDFVEAELYKADLSGDGPTGVNLYRANLRGVNLVGANLQAANLRDADLENATFGFTILGDADLSGARGLAACRHTAQAFWIIRRSQNPKCCLSSFFRDVAYPKG